MRAGAVSLLFPPRCAACGDLLRFEGFGGGELPVLCPGCARQWESEKLSACGRCGRPVFQCVCLTEELTDAGCAGFCKLVYYLNGRQPPVQNRMLYHLKNTPDRRTAAFLAGELEEPVKALLRQSGDPPLRDVALVFIPRSRRAVRQTGTDQARRLAKALSMRMGVPLIPALIRRWGSGRQQKALKRRERRQNAGRAYRLRRGTDLRGKTVLLVDDIVTTGASMAAAARLLRRAGAVRVCCVAVASDDCNQSMGVRPPQLREPPGRKSWRQ